MGLWSKVFKKRPSALLLSFNQEELKKEALKNWISLYEQRGEASWRLLMRQLDIYMNQELLNLSRMEISEKGLTRLAVHKGVVDFISSLKMTIEHEFNRLQKQKIEKDRQSGYGEKVVGKPAKRRTRPTLS
jgi:hypothetical protein